MSPLAALDRFRGRRVGVLGLARSGLAATRALQAVGATVLVWDDDPAALARHPELAPGRPADVAGLAALVVSPGVPLTHPAPHPLIEAARAAKVPLTCDIELFCDGLGPRPLVAVTGTNGKSTTSALCHHLLVAAGRDAVLGGNIGVPALDLDPGPSDRVVVLETSSFQLDLCTRLRPRVACWLNLTPDHLDRHGDVAGYVAAKMRIFRNQRDGDTAVIGVDDAPSRTVAAGLRGPRVIAVSTREAIAPGVYVRDGVLIDASDGAAREVVDLSALPTLPGRHNQQNAAVAFAALRALGLHADAIVPGLATFPGLPHRLEEVARGAGVRWINDSKATNPEAAARALGSFRNIYWIAGGRAKPGGFRDLRPHLGSVRAAFLIGEAAAAMAGDLGDLAPMTVVGTLEAAVTAAARAATADGHGDAVVLLAPACASFDQFRSYEHRGDVFRRLARMQASGRAAA
jgi:UDP-N-acetylmuramoylalanine--D-glutamate ligase